MVSESGDFTSGTTDDNPNAYHAVLDHGYVRLIETWGSDERIIEAARMSTNKGFQGWHGICTKCLPNDDGVSKNPDCPDCKGTGDTGGDMKLLRFLYENKHHTPFEMGGMTIEVQAPIFVFREWHRHRTQSYNELSARYTPMPNLNYVPSKERLMQVNAQTKNKQAQGTGKAFDVLAARDAQTIIELIQTLAEDNYQIMLQMGVAKELARLVIPVSRYSRMRASTDLRNWLGFLSLRMHKDAQWEIRQYANVVGNLISYSFPRTWELFSTPK